MAVKMSTYVQGGHEDRATLKALEEKLSLEEIAHFRAGVASKHSK